MARILQFVSHAPAAKAESRYAIGGYRLAVPACEAGVGDIMAESRGIVIAIEKGKYRSHDRLTFMCRCGQISDPVRRYHLVSGHTKSCGHLRNTWAAEIYSQMSAEERSELFIHYFTEGKKKTATLHSVPLFVVDYCRRRHLEDMMADEDLVSMVMSTVKGSARFNDAIRRAARYSERSLVEVRAIYEKAKKSAAKQEFPVRFELSSASRALLERALEGLLFADDPIFRSMTVSEAADQLLATIKDATEIVAISVNDDLHLTSAEFPTPGTAAFTKSKGLLGWCYAVLNVMTADDIKTLGYECKWLLRVFRRNISSREQRRLAALEALRAGLTSTRKGRGTMNRFGWKAPAIDSNAAADVLRAGNDFEVLVANAA